MFALLCNVVSCCSQAAAAKAENDEVRGVVIGAGRESGTAFNSMLAQVHIVSLLP